MRSLLLLAGLCVLSACGERDPRPAQGESVKVVLERVTIRQYLAGKQRFEFDAPRVVLDEKGAVVEVTQGVKGRLEEWAWEDDKR